jgi:hypothetical protein
MHRPLALLPFSVLLLLGACSATTGSTPATPSPDAAGSEANDGGADADARAADADAESPVASTVRGRVVSRIGSPFPRVPVRIGDVDTMTDEEGGFVVENAPPTYDAVITLPSLHVTILTGLASREPVLVSDRHVHGWPSGDAATVKVLPSNLDSSTVFSTALAPDARGFTFLVDRETQEAIHFFGWWPAGSSKSADLLTLAYSWSPSQGVRHFAGAAFEALTVRDREVRTVRPTLLPVEEREIALDVVAAEGQVVESASAAVRLPTASDSDWRLVGAPTAPVAVTKVLVPKLAGVDVAVGITTTSSTRSRERVTTYAPVGFADTPGRIAVPPPPRFLSPAPDAVLRTGTRLEWAGRGRCTLDIEPVSGAESRLGFHIVSEAGSMVFPDLGSVGFPLPSKTRHVMRVACESTDDRGHFSRATGEERFLMTE